MRLTTALLCILALTGCYDHVEPGVTGHDLNMAYIRCIKTDDDLIENRIACTQAVYGGDIYETH